MTAFIITLNSKVKIQATSLNDFASQKIEKYNIYARLDKSDTKDSKIFWIPNEYSFAAVALENRGTNTKSWAQFNWFILQKPL